MAETQNTSSTTPGPPYKDNDGNEITRGGKLFAGILIIFFTFFSAFYLIGHWPDRIPGPKDNTTSLYTFRWFHVRLIDSLLDTSAHRKAVTPVAQNGTDSTLVKSDSATGTMSPPVGDVPAPVQEPVAMGVYAGSRDNLIHINTLLLIMVGVAGFLGSMIHISASFTSYIGAGKFRKSWILWYFVKPFTAAALAIAVYFVFRGGFLNMSDDSSNINIYGLMTISIFSGLFTDRTTLKLKEVFEVLFRPKDDRPDRLKNGGLKINTVDAAPLEAGQSTVITLKGEKMDEGKVDISVGDDIIQNMERTADSISFAYTLPDALKNQDTVLLSVKPENAVTANSYPLKIKAASVSDDTTAGTNKHNGSV